MTKAELDPGINNDTEDAQNKFFQAMITQDPYEVSAKSLDALADEIKQVAGEVSQNLLNARDYIRNLENRNNPSQMVVCAHCGKQLTNLELLVSTGQQNTEPTPCLHDIGEIGKNIKRNLPAIELETSWENWQDRSIKETALDKIRCPFCHNFPFDDKMFYLKYTTKIVLFPNTKPINKDNKVNKEVNND